MGVGRGLSEIRVGTKGLVNREGLRGLYHSPDWNMDQQSPTAPGPLHLSPEPVPPSRYLEVYLFTPICTCLTPSLTV